jgi:putative queuosine salvage protein
VNRLTIFADNLVPHVLRVDGVLIYDPELEARIDRGELLPPGREEQEIRACAVHACELIARELHVAPRTVDTWLWNRGQDPRYKAVPRHRTRTVYY